MGIRYYAYAFESELTQAVVADPMSVISDDPLADAWGMEPGFSIGVIGERTVPERDMLYLDKAWSALQWVVHKPSSGRGVRPAHRMFEGNVTWTDRGSAPWTRAITPDEAVEIARDLDTLPEDAVASRLRSQGTRFRSDEEEIEYVLHFYRKAKEFLDGVVEDSRGFAYMIG